MAQQIKMQGLHRLHQIMRANGDSRARFSISHNLVDFECLFLVDVTPYEFVLAAVGHPDVAVVCQVRKGYYVDADFGDDYKPLARLFNQGAETFVPFRPGIFLQEIDSAVPVNYRKPTVTEVAKIYRHHLDEADKPYFIGWLDNNLKPPNRVSDSNLEKTKRCFGNGAYETCKRTNLSSRWTADISKSKTSPPPPPPPRVR